MKNTECSTLSPANDAAKQHSYRAFRTVQQWIGNNLSPEEWGWKMSNETLVPKEREKVFAPDKFLNMVSCGCKTKTCSCKKIDLLYCNVL